MTNDSNQNHPIPSPGREKAPHGKSGPCEPEKTGPWWDYPRFKDAGCKVLLLGATHLLLPEIKNALTRLGHRVSVVITEKGSADLCLALERMTGFLRRARPDFVLTVNHSGFDNQGAFTQLLTQCRIPFASWYVDSPHLILDHYAQNRSDFLFLFTWDADYVEILEKRGFNRVAHLPLGVDESVFRPDAAVKPGEQPRINVGFVGNSMAVKVASILNRNRITGPLLTRLPRVAGAFETAEDLLVRQMLSRCFPELVPWFERLSPWAKIAYETAVTWQATGAYRLERIKTLEKFSPVIAGDPGWQSLVGPPFVLMPELDYYTVLPGFYASCRVNFNATSRQMKNGVNQRVFDAPACGGLLITDRTRQLEGVMIPGKEVLAYDFPHEIPDLTQRALKDADWRKSVARAGRRRVLGEHTYVHRLQTLVFQMKKTYG